MPDIKDPWVALASGVLTAEIDPLGAQLSSLQDARGRELLWNGDPAFWSGRAPLLFPIVGELAEGGYRLGAKHYRLPRHGFARRSRFTRLAATSMTAGFQLSPDAALLSIYPFPFDLRVVYSLSGASLTVTTSIRNDGTEAMPASFGYHPGLRWPLPYGSSRDAHVIDFDRDEPAPIRRLDSQGLLAPEPYPSPVKGHRLVLSDDLFRHDAVIFDQLRSRSVTYGPEAGPRIRIDFPDSPILGVWSKPGAEFVCIEPWHGIADPAGYAGDFRHKPGIETIAPGATLEVTMTIALVADPTD